uniref:Prolyl endopeptidase n=1 Tax=Salix viminalis TaxID=40686 RepID=A0A6N2MWC1_SALVM
MAMPYKISIIILEELTCTVWAGVAGGHNRSGLNKCNSIHDFISCGNYLISEGYVHKDRLGAIGFSAGGLLVGAAINMNPNLFRAAILKVPFLDACNTLLDPSLPLTLLDYEEFGNPQIQSQFESILSYSPYDNIPRDACLPSMLGWSLGSCQMVILKTNMAGGHFGEGGCYSQCEETAYDYAFLMKTIGNSFHHSFSHLADDWSIQKIGGLAWGCLLLYNEGSSCISRKVGNQQEDSRSAQGRGLCLLQTVEGLKHHTTFLPR